MGIRNISGMENREPGAVCPSVLRAPLPVMPRSGRKFDRSAVNEYRIDARPLGAERLDARPANAGGSGDRKRTPPSRPIDLGRTVLLV